MIEFTLNKNSKGRRSRWSKKYPRKSILKKGSKVVGWYANNWIDDTYCYLDGNLTKFLLANVGKPVDMVFSKFLQRCSKSARKYNLREEFYSMFKSKEDIGYAGGFYITNGIINYKKRRKRPNSSYTPSLYYSSALLNHKHLPSKNVLYDICKKAEQTHEKQYIGRFYVVEGPHSRVRETSVYVATKEDYKKQYSHMKLSEIAEVGIGVNFGVYDTQSKVREIISHYTLRSAFRWHVPETLPNYVFLTKVAISDK